MVKPTAPRWNPIVTGAAVSSYPATESEDADFTYSPVGAQVSPQDQWKQPVVAATTADITVSTALNDSDTLDGVTLAAGDRVLVKNQSTASGNGIYVVAGTPYRAPDFDDSAEVLGAAVYVIGGTVNAASAWYCTNTTAPTIDTDDITFADLSGVVSLALSDLTDVGTATPTDGQVLTYGTATAEWAPADASGGCLAADDQGRHLHLWQRGRPAGRSAPTTTC